ncbi:hypothetical protein [Peterkaempfera sp. SMS 1(5)a]|uniref:hypothetical protein n=1 Tax=Peterkaempfera podocarpi TaxID=3232308 RepID=UPI00366A64A1
MLFDADGRVDIGWDNAGHLEMIATLTGRGDDDRESGEYRSTLRCTHGQWKLVHHQVVLDTDPR